jgi:hypothetical protein
MPHSKEAIKKASKAYKERNKQAGIERKSIWIKPETYTLLDNMSADMSAKTGNKKPACMAEILEKALNNYMSADMSAKSKETKKAKREGRKWNDKLLHKAKELTESGLKPIEVYNELANEYPATDLPSKSNIARWLKNLLNLIEINHHDQHTN